MILKSAHLAAIAVLGIIVTESSLAQKIIQTPELLATAGTMLHSNLEIEHDMLNFNSGTMRSVTLSLNEPDSRESTSVYDLGAYSPALSDSVSKSVGPCATARDGSSISNISSADPTLPASASIVKAVPADMRAASGNSDGILFFGGSGNVARQTPGSACAYSQAVGAVPESGSTSFFAALVLGSAVSSFLLRKRRKRSVVGAI